MKSIYNYVICFIFLINSSSCEKYLNLEPQNNTYDEVFWTDAANISKAVSGSYSMLRDALRNTRCYFVFGDLAAGNFDVGSDYWNYESLIKSGGFVFSYVPYLEDGLWNWTRFYQIVNQCHLIIENTPLIPDENFEGGVGEKNWLIAQAKFVRAYTYFYMQRVWGDVLLTKESYKDPQNIPPIARSPEEETLDFCIEDLTFALDILDNSESKSYGSLGATQALLAHIYAWRHDYENTQKYATEVINSSYSLENIENYLDIWKGNSKESIFEINMLYNDSGEEFSSEFFNAFLADPTVSNKSMNSAWPVDEYVISNVFEDYESRFDSIFRYDGNNNYLLRKYENVIYYNENNSSDYAVSNNLVIFRLADIYLLRAEAYNKIGNDQLALIDLNLIRNRAGLESVNSTGNDLFLDIFYERQRELIGEGSTQFDLIRMELFDKLDEYSSYYTQDRIEKEGYYWPLYMRVLLPQDELLTQNEWWTNN